MDKKFRQAGFDVPDVYGIKTSDDSGMPGHLLITRSAGRSCRKWRRRFHLIAPTHAPSRSLRSARPSVRCGFQPLFDRRKSTFQGGAGFPNRDMPHNASFEPCEPRLL